METACSCASPSSAARDGGIFAIQDRISPNHLACSVSAPASRRNTTAGDRARRPTCAFSVSRERVGDRPLGERPRLRGDPAPFVCGSRVDGDAGWRSPFRPPAASRRDEPSGDRRSNPAGLSSIRSFRSSRALGAPRTGTKPGGEWRLSRRPSRGACRSEFGRSRATTAPTDSGTATDDSIFDLTRRSVERDLSRDLRLDDGISGGPRGPLRASPSGSAGEPRAGRGGE
jgi:hypothetical protein